MIRITSKVPNKPTGARKGCNEVFLEILKRLYVYMVPE